MKKIIPNLLCKQATIDLDNIEMAARICTASLLRLSASNVSMFFLQYLMY